MIDKIEEHYLSKKTKLKSIKGQNVTFILGSESLSLVGTF